MNSYSTTLLPPSPLRLSPYKFPLPDTDEELLAYYRYLRIYLDRLWVSYLTYCKLVHTPEASKIFEIIFIEMDYFEAVISTIIDKMSDTFKIVVPHEYLI